LRQLPVPLLLNSKIFLEADLRESVWIPIWRYGCYPHQLKDESLSLSFLKNGDNVWDIGANVGYTSVLYADKVGTNGSVLAIEPSPRAFKHLTRSIRNYTCIKAIQIALSDKSGEVEFLERAALDRSCVTIKNCKSSIKIMTSTLDELWIRQAYNAPKFIKIDVEGHEINVFRGGSKLIREKLPIIQFEALTSDEFYGATSVLNEIAGGKYSFYCHLQDGSVNEVFTWNIIRGSNNFFALTKSHIDQLPQGYFPAGAV